MTSIQVSSLHLVNAEEGKAVVPLTKRLTTIGTSADSHIVLPKNTGLENHGFILFQMGQYKIKNLATPQDMKINGSPVEDSAILKEGDTIQIGSFRMLFGGKDPSAETSRCSDGISGILESFDPKEILRIFSTLLRTVSDLVAENDQKQTAIKLVEVIARLMHCDGVRLLMNREDKEGPELLAVYPSLASAERFSRSALQWANQKGRAVLVSNAEDDAELSPEESMVIKEIRSVMCAPLGSDPTNWLGYLYLDRLKGHVPFSNTDMGLFEELRELFSRLLTNVAQRQKQSRAIRILQESSKDSAREAMIYQSPAMEQMVEQAVRVANADIPVLIQGETGTGKEVLARFIHRSSSRNTGPFVAVNCGAIPENLMESEFFGHEKGAFTGAVAAKKGYMETAKGGTLFLDEISELPQNLQVKLLRALQEKEISPVGSAKTLPIDIRILSASNKDLEDEVASGNFRQDLFFRLNVMSLVVPPLRDRERDVILLAHHFAKQAAIRYGMEEKAFSSSTEKAILAHKWSGNVRELENRMQKAMILCKGNLIQPEEIDLAPGSDAGASSQTLEIARQEAEKRAIDVALTKAKGNVSLASKLLDVNRVVLNRMLKKLSIDASKYR